MTASHCLARCLCLAAPEHKDFEGDPGAPCRGARLQRYSAAGEGACEVPSLFQAWQPGCWQPLARPQRRWSCCHRPSACELQRRDGHHTPWLCRDEDEALDALAADLDGLWHVGVSACPGKPCLHTSCRGPCPKQTQPTHFFWFSVDLKRDGGACPPDLITVAPAAAPSAAAALLLLPYCCCCCCCCCCYYCCCCCCCCCCQHSQSVLLDPIGLPFVPSCCFMASAGQELAVRAACGSPSSAPAKVPAMEEAWSSRRAANHIEVSVCLNVPCFLSGPSLLWPCNMLCAKHRLVRLMRCSVSPEHRWPLPGSVGC